MGGRSRREWEEGERRRGGGGLERNGVDRKRGYKERISEGKREAEVEENGDRGRGERGRGVRERWSR